MAIRRLAEDVAEAICKGDGVGGSGEGLGGGAASRPCACDAGVGARCLRNGAGGSGDAGGRGGRERRGATFACPGPGKSSDLPLNREDLCLPLLLRRTYELAPFYIPRVVSLAASPPSEIF